MPPRGGTTGRRKCSEAASGFGVRSARAEGRKPFATLSLRHIFGLASPPAFILAVGCGCLAMPARLEALTASVPGQILLAAGEAQHAGATAQPPTVSSVEKVSPSTGAAAKAATATNAPQAAVASPVVVATPAATTAATNVVAAKAVAVRVKAPSEETNMVWVAPLTPGALSVASEAPPPPPTVTPTNDIAAAEASKTNVVLALPEPIAGAPREVLLSMTDLMGVALDESPDVLIEKLPLKRAEAWLKLQRSTFEPRFSGSGTYAETDRIQNYWDYSYLRPGERFLRIDETRSKRISGGITGKLPIGTSLSFDTDYSELDSSQWDRVNSLGVPIYPYHETAEGRTGLTITQPLLRGFGAQATLSEIRVARASLASADVTWRQSVARRLSGIARAYLDLYAAYDDMDMVRQLEAKIRDAAAKGEAQESDVQQWVEAREAAGKRIESLQKQLIRQTREREEWWKDQPEYWVRPLEVQPAACPVVPKNSELLTLVFEAPDYQIARSRVEQVWHRLRKAKNDMLPKVDVFGRAGLGGYGEDTDAVWEEMQDQNRNDWSMGVRVEIGLGGDIAAQAKRDQYSVDLRTAEESLKNLEFDLREQLKGAFEACVEAFSTYEKARDSRRAAESYAVDRPEYYRTLRQAEIRSLGLYERAIITLEMLEGKFPERYGVRFVDKGEVSAGLAVGNGKRKQAPADR